MEAHFRVLMVGQTSSFWEKEDLEKKGRKEKRNTNKDAQPESKQI